MFLQNNTLSDTHLLPIQQTSITNTKMNIFTTERYTIVTSLVFRTCDIRVININIKNNFGYVCYDGNFEEIHFVMDFKMTQHMVSIYEVINKCFDNILELEHNRNVDDQIRDWVNRPPVPNKSDSSSVAILKLDHGMLKLLFDCDKSARLGDIKFYLYLQENLVSVNNKLIMNMLERLERMVEKTNHLETKMEALQHAEIRISNIYSFPIDSNTIEVDARGNSISHESFEKIKHFYQLEELVIKNCMWVDFGAISNTTVKKLTIIDSNRFNDMSFINNFPELVELVMRGFKLNATTMQSIPHKIRKLTLQCMSEINQTELQSYCDKNGIELVIQ